MDYSFIQSLGLSTIAQVSTILATVVGAVLLVWGALVGLGFIKKYVSRWIGSSNGGSIRYRNLPGDSDYDPTKGSFIESHGSNVNIPQGGRIF